MFVFVYLNMNKNKELFYFFVIFTKGYKRIIYKEQYIIKNIDNLKEFIDYLG
jgi:hypothetical protein